VLPVGAAPFIYDYLLEKRKCGALSTRRVGMVVAQFGVLLAGGMNSALQCRSL